MYSGRLSSVDTGVIVTAGYFLLARFVGIKGRRKSVMNGIWEIFFSCISIPFLHPLLFLCFFTVL